MIYYKNTEGDEFDSTTIHPERPSYNESLLLAPEFEFLMNFDFKNFNFPNFEQDVMDMPAGSFEWWYEELFKKWLFKLDDLYLDLDFEKIHYKFNNQEEKRIFLLKVVNFVMFMLPYQILRPIFKNLNIENQQELEEYLSDEISLIDLRELIIEEIEKNKVHFVNFIATLYKFEKVAKKNFGEMNIDLLNEHVEKQNLFLNIFQDIIKETDMEKMREFIKMVVNSDAKNLF